MKNETLLNQAIELLGQIEAKDIEAVQIENTNHNDGSIGFYISVTYPSDKKSEIGFKPEISD